MTAPTSAAVGGLVDGPGHVERLGADVDGRHREARDLAAAAGHVQLLDARRLGAERLAGLPDEPLGGGGRRLIGAEGGRPGEVADRGLAEGRLVVDDEPVAVEVGSVADDAQQVGRRGRDVGHRSVVSSGQGSSDHGTAREAPAPSDRSRGPWRGASRTWNDRRPGGRSAAGGQRDVGVDSSNLADTVASRHRRRSRTRPDG